MALDSMYFIIACMISCVGPLHVLRNVDFRAMSHASRFKSLNQGFSHFLQKFAVVLLGAYVF